MKRGEIYYIEKGYNEVGSEQRTGRPAIIVSNDKCNEHSAVVEVVYLTTQPKSDLPTHIDIRSTPKTSVALCEQISSVSKERIGQYVGQCSEYEMLMLEAALEISLGIESRGGGLGERAEGSDQRSCEDGRGSCSYADRRLHQSRCRERYIQSSLRLAL